VRWPSTPLHALLVEDSENDVGASTIARDVTEHKRAEEALDETREAKRNRIARGLHDDTLQDIVYALQEIQVAQITSEDGRASALEEAAEALRRSLEGLRRAIFELRLNKELDRSFISSLEILLDLNRRLARKRYELDLIVDDAFPRVLPEGIGREIARIVQEALANARRHAEPRRVGMRLELDDDLARVEVFDDGCSFDTGKPGVGMGQQSMRHLACELGENWWLRVRRVAGRACASRSSSHAWSGRVVRRSSADRDHPRFGDEGVPTA